MIISKKKLMICSFLCVLCGFCLLMSAVTFVFAEQKNSEAPAYEYEYPEVDSLTLPSILSDGMVLQQGEKVHLWGLTVAGRQVTATLALASSPDSVIAEANAVAGENGRFDIEIDGRTASFDKYVVKISDGVSTIEIKDVLFGEVWLTGGQSNMELQLQYVIDGPELIRAARSDEKYENLRIFLEPTMPEGKDIYSQFSYLPQFDIKGARWGKANIKDDVKIVSAVSYSCAQKMFEELNADGEDIPVAIINTAVGATSIEAWMSRTSIDNTPEVVDWLKNVKGNYISWENWTDSRPEKFNQMTAMFNEKIAPIAGFNVKGLLWYQGENNMGDQKSADFYSVALPAMVKDWSLNWWGDEKPFYCAFFHINQKEDNYTPESIPLFLEGLSTAWSENREFMMQVPIYDIPLTWDYGSFQYKATAHPLVKIPVGQRAARIVLGKVYEKYDDYLPATYVEKEIKDGAIYVKFENTAGRLYAKDGMPIRGFTVCGEDRVYVAAQAEIIDANTVKVWSEDVKDPVDVTYAFTCFNYSSNLYNGIDLPVIPFRSVRNSADVYYHAKDWMYADSLELWRDDGLPIGSENGGGAIRTVWQANTISIGFGSTLSTESGAQGNAVCFSYGKPGVFGFGVTGPKNRNTKNHLNNMVFGQFEKYKGLEINIKNNDNREKNVSVLIKTADGTIYTLPVATDYSPFIKLKSSQEYQKIIFSLDCLLDENGYCVYDTEDILLNVVALEIRVDDTAAGSISVDELKLRKVGVATVGLQMKDGFIGTGNYSGGKTEIVTGISGAVGYSVLTLGKQGVSFAEYDLNRGVSAKAEFLVRGGTFAVRTEDGIAPFDGLDVSLDDAIMTYIGSDGYKYAQADGVWYRYNAGSGEYNPITGENAIYPRVELPEELTPSVFAEVLVNGVWKKAEVSIDAIGAIGGFTQEKYSFALPQGGEKIRVCFTAPWREQTENGSSGMVPDREHSLMLSSVEIYGTKEVSDQKPQVVLKSEKTVYQKGETVVLQIAASDDVTSKEDMDIKVYLCGGDERKELTNASFTMSQDCRIEVVVKDGAGNETTQTLELKLGNASDVAENETHLGLILGITVPITVIALGVMTFVLVRKNKGEKKA